MESQKRSWKLQEFVAHKANVNCLAMGHKSNQVLATGGDDKKVNLWAIGRENCLMSLSGHTTPVECVCFGHSEDLVCAGSQTGTLKIWDLEAAKLLRTLTGHKGAIKCMDFHPYGDYLTTGSCDSSIKLWDTRKKGCIVTYPGHRLAVNSLQFSPDGQWIASACEEGILKVWDVRVGKVLHEFVEHTSAVTCVKFHPHEFLLASSGADYTVNFWDMEKFQLVSKFEKQGTCMRSMMFSEDGSTLLGSANNGLYVVGWEPTRLLDTVQLHWGHIQDMTIAQTQLIAGSFHSTYVVVSVVDLNKVYPFGGPPVDMKVEETSPFQKGHSVRKSFSKEKPSKQVIHKSTVLDDKTAEESTSGTEADDENGAVIPNITDYTEIFRPSRALTRTPPPLSPTLSTRTYDIAESEVDKNDSRNCLAKLKCVKQGTPCMCANKARSLIKARTRSNEVCKKCTFKNDVLGNGSKDESVPSASNSSVRRERKEESIPLSANVVKRERNTKEEPIPVTITTGKKEKSSKEEAAQATPITTTANATTAMSRDLLPSMPIATLPAVTLPPMPASKPSTPPPPRTTSNRDVSARSPLNRHNSYKETKHSDNITAPAGIKQSSSDISLGPTSVGQRSLSFTRTTTDLTRRRVEPARDDLIDQSPEPEFIPFATDRPVGLDLDEFLPRNTVLPGGSRSAVPAPSEQEVLGVMMRGHDSMMCVLTARQRALQIFHSVRINKSLKSALESVIALEDQSVILDILNIMAHKPSLWNLDICLLMLPKISELLQSKYESYMQCGCNALRLVVRNFSSVVRANVSAPVRTLGVDIPREERYAKCVQIHRQLIDLRAFLLKRQTLQGRLGAAFRDLHNLMQQGLD